MLVRIFSMVLRVCGILVLILGILFWAHAAGGIFVLIHMLLGILVALSLIALGFVIATAKKGGSIGLGIGALVVAILVIGLGLTQQGLLAKPGDPHWIIQFVHMLLGLLAIGMGEMITARYRRAGKVA